MLDALLEDLEITQLNWNPTRRRARQRPSCLDLFLTNIPAKIAKVEPIINNTSEHEEIRCSFSDTEFTCNEQFITFRKYEHMKTHNIMEYLDEDKYHEIFQISDVEMIAEKIMSLFTEIIDILAPERIQVRQKNKADSAKTRDLRAQTHAQFKRFKKSNSMEDQPYLKMLRNRLDRSMKSDIKNKKRR